MVSKIMPVSTRCLVSCAYQFQGMARKKCDNKATAACESDPKSIGTKLRLQVMIVGWRTRMLF